MGMLADLEMLQDMRVVRYDPALRKHHPDSKPPRFALYVAKTDATFPLSADAIYEIWRVVVFSFYVAFTNIWQQARYRQDHQKQPPKIAFFPHEARPWYSAWVVPKLAGMKFVKNIHDADILFYFMDTVHAKDEEFTEAKALGKPIINMQCTDISKTRVNQAFSIAFGRDLAVDPLSFTGRMVEKSEGNGVHDGRILQGPISVRRDNMVYQRLIENTEDGEIYTDIRTPIINGKIPAIYLKQRKKDARISNDNFRVLLTNQEEQLSAEEAGQIADFAKEMGLDYGGMDILRDRESGLIYIVDVNKTDMAPPTGLPYHDKTKAMNKLAAEFKNYVATLLK